MTSKREPELFETSIGKVQVWVEFDEHNEECLTVSTPRGRDRDEHLPDATAYFSHVEGELCLRSTHLLSRDQPIPDPMEKEWRAEWLVEKPVMFRTGGLPRPLVDEFTAIAEEWLRKHPDAFEQEARDICCMTIKDTIREIDETAHSLRSVAQDRDWEAGGPYMRMKPGAAEAIRRAAKLMRTMARQLAVEKRRLARYHEAKAA